MSLAKSPSQVIDKTDLLDTSNTASTKKLNGKIDWKEKLRKKRNAGGHSQKVGPKTLNNSPKPSQSNLKKIREIYDAPLMQI